VPALLTPRLRTRCKTLNPKVQKESPSILVAGGDSLERGSSCWSTQQALVTQHAAWRWKWKWKWKWKLTTHMRRLRNKVDRKLPFLCKRPPCRQPPPPRRYWLKFVDFT